MILGLTQPEFWAVVAITLGAGFVKGAVGFAMPTIMMSAFASFLSPLTALAILIVPTLVTNVLQAFRQGVRPAIETTRRFRLHIAPMAVFILVSAAFVRDIPQAAMYLALGVPITAFALWQLSGQPVRMQLHHRSRAEAISGVIGGLYGGISGIWGPPLIVYLLAVNTPKPEQMRVQGVVFLIGAVVLLAAHLGSGVLNAVTLPLSALMVLPALLGMWLGLVVHDRLDTVRFRRWTLVLLVVTGLNLLRRGLAG